MATVPRCPRAATLAGPESAVAKSQQTMAGGPWHCCASSFTELAIDLVDMLPVQGAAWGSHFPA